MLSHLWQGFSFSFFLALYMEIGLSAVGKKLVCADLGLLFLLV